MKDVLEETGDRNIDENSRTNYHNYQFSFHKNYCNAISFR